MTATPAPATHSNPGLCVALLAEASAHLSDAADPDPARVAAAHSAHAVKMAQYHMCLAER